MDFPQNSKNVPAPHERILALDVGRKRIGLAVSDALGVTAQGLPTLARGRIRDDLDQLRELAAARDIRLLLIGNPIHMSGRDSAQAGYVREFGERLAAYTALPVEYWDERLTSVEANRVLRSSGIGIEKRARAVDKLSAVLLLESYLERMCWQAEAEEAAAEPEEQAEGGEDPSSPSC